MKNEIEELMMLTPKRKSILWRYKSDEDESIFVYGISKGRAIALSGEFAVNKEEVLKNKEKVKQLKDDSDINDGGISVLLENVSARIWELCDGSNTLKDIVNYNLSVQEAANTDVEEDVIKYFQKRGVLSKIIKEELTYPESLSDEEINKIRVVAYSQGYDDFSKTALETIGKNKSRNLRIMQKLRELNSEKKPTIVFACSVKHAQLLSAMLTLEDIPNAVVYGDMPAYERTTAISRFKDTKDNMNIIINYEVLTTGFDATNIECVFIARPTQSVVLYSQMIGRGLRGPQMGGNEICLLVDVKDNLKQYDENMAFSHFNNYWGA